MKGKKFGSIIVDEIVSHGHTSRFFKREGAVMNSYMRKVPKVKKQNRKERSGLQHYIHSRRYGARSLMSCTAFPMVCNKIS